MGIIDTRIQIENNVFYGKFSEGFMEEWLKIIKLLPVKTEIRDGMILEIGFTLYKLVALENGDYRLFSVDYEHNPLEGFTEDLTIALWIQSEQSSFIKKLDIKYPKNLRFDDSISVAKGVFNSGNYYLQRVVTNNHGKSHWFVGYQDRDNNDISRIYAYELLSKKTELIKVLSLPDEYIVVIEGEKIVAVLNENDEVIFES